MIQKFYGHGVLTLFDHKESSGERTQLIKELEFTADDDHVILIFETTGNAVQEDAAKSARSEVRIRHARPYGADPNVHRNNHLGFSSQGRANPTLVIDHR